MRLFWWQKLPLLMLIHLLQPNTTSHNNKIYAEALLSFKISLGNPCLRQRASCPCHELKHPLVPLFPSIYTLDVQDKTEGRRRRRRSIAEADDENSSVPTLTPSRDAHVKQPRNKKLAAILGGVGAAVLVIVIVFLVYLLLMHLKRVLRQQASETASSVPSPSTLSPYETRDLRQLAVSELKQATSNFNRNNIIGEDRSSLVYKGLLQDGNIVAIKRLYFPTPNFFHQVKNISRARHVHLVRFIGYCDAGNVLLLAYEYIPNGNVGNHLYDSEGFPSGKLNMQQRLSIALGAARGLEYLHSLVPPLLHMQFRTSNILTDDNFTPKLSDYGLSRLITRNSLASSSSSSSAIDFFLDPELDLSRKFSERSDVYSFGVFLLELISGCKANFRSQSNSRENLVIRAKEINGIEKFVDRTLGDDASLLTAKPIMELALRCIETDRGRPMMKRVVEELERVQERAMEVKIEEEEIANVALGSELFR